MIYTILHLSADQSDDSKFKMKFRGMVEIGAGYYFDEWQGNENDRIGDFLYQQKDMTNTGDPQNGSHNDNVGRLLGGWGGIEVGIFSQFSMIAPFLTADNSLFSGNNIRVNLNTKINPAAIGIGMDFVITPVAFYYFSFGFNINGGWGIPGMCNGLARNIKGEPEGYGFMGPLVEISFENVLQFDASYLMPEKFKRWTHIIFLSSALFKYKALASINENEPFYYENDIGENLNGWEFNSTFILGYKIPVIEDDIGENGRFLKFNNDNFAITMVMMVTIEQLRLTHNSDSTISNKGWGSDFVNVRFGPVINFDLPRNFFTLIQFQFANDKRYTEDTFGNKFYQDRVYEDYFLYFRRIGMMFGWRF